MALNVKQRLENQVSGLAIAQSGRTLPERVLAGFIRFFVRLNRFYNQLYEKAKPGWMKKP